MRRPDISIFIEMLLTAAIDHVISNFIERTADVDYRQTPLRSDGTASAAVLRRGDSLGELSLMKSTAAVEALGALAQEHRLALFRLLVQAGDKGLAAGAIADKLGVPNSSLSFHLTQLRNAGLILQERQHRSLIYRANYPAMNALVAFLTENCCGGADCAPAAACDKAQERKFA